MAKTDSKSPRVRRTFTPEFKAGAVRLVLQEGRSRSAVAKSLGLSESSLCAWVKQAQVDAGTGPAGALTTDERATLNAELVDLRRRLRQAELEREILKKATAFFAKEST